MRLLDCALIGVCAVISSNTVVVIDKSLSETFFFLFLYFVVPNMQTNNLTSNTPARVVPYLSLHF